MIKNHCPFFYSVKHNYSDNLVANSHILLAGGFFISYKRQMADTLKRPDDSEMCEPGFHVVQGFKRVCHSGVSTWVDAHVRRNRGKNKSGLLIENIHFLFWQNKKVYATLKPILDFGKKGSEFDSVIQFWLEYWSSSGIEFPKNFDPLLIKSLIAYESSFNTKAKNPGGTASGLMQITDQSLRVLAGFPNKSDWIEIRKNLIFVEKAERFDPIVSIALGTRLLGHKFSQIKKLEDRTAEKLVARYNQKGPEGLAYAKKIIEIYEKSKMAR